jgi:aldehyde dehydrogenase (NAD+)
MAEKMKWSSEGSTTRARRARHRSVVDDKQLAQNLQYVVDRHGEGARLVGGARRSQKTAMARPGYYMRPALFAETTAPMRINRDEVFGPG